MIFQRFTLFKWTRHNYPVESDTILPCDDTDQAVTSPERLHSKTFRQMFSFQRVPTHVGSGRQLTRHPQNSHYHPSQTTSNPHDSGSPAMSTGLVSCRFLKIAPYSTRWTPFCIVFLSVLISKLPRIKWWHQLSGRQLIGGKSPKSTEIFNLWVGCAHVYL